MNLGFHQGCLETKGGRAFCGGTPKWIQEQKTLVEGQGTEADELFNNTDPRP